MTYTLPVFVVNMTIFQSILDLLLSPVWKLFITIENVKILLKVKTIECSAELDDDVLNLPWCNTAPSSH